MKLKNHFGSVDSDTGKELRTGDPIISWWISYHRHLYTDVILLTQNWQDIHISYRRNISYFLDAIDSQSKALGHLSPTLQFDQHKTAPYTKKNKAGKIKVKKREEIFDQYESGDAVRTKSVVLPWVILAVFLFVIVGFMLKIILSSFGGDKKEDSNTTVIVKAESETKSLIKRITHTDKKEKVDSKFRGKKYLEITCLGKTCFNKEFKIKLSSKDFKKVCKMTKTIILNTSNYSLNNKVYTVIATAEFISIFKGADNEKNYNGNNGLIN
ncbi:MAG: hypothetical protein Q9M36_03035 [Sulfurovum sp.]|nr:hypothetical protein [Sulfurovum sp.]